MDKRSSNVCIRCGKERIESKSWEETAISFMGKTVVTYTETVCPDPECQKIVEKQLAAQKKKREELEQSKEDRKVRLKEQRSKARLH